MRFRCGIHTHVHTTLLCAHKSVRRNYSSPDEEFCCMKTSKKTNFKNAFRWFLSVSPCVCLCAQRARRTARRATTTRPRRPPCAARAAANATTTCSPADPATVRAPLLCGCSALYPRAYPLVPGSHHILVQNLFMMEPYPTPVKSNKLWRIFLQLVYLLSSSNSE